MWSCCGLCFGRLVVRVATCSGAESVQRRLQVRVTIRIIESVCFAPRGAQVLIWRVK